MQTHLNYWYNAVLNSYSQLFFSVNKVLALAIIFATFCAPHIGLTGLLAVLITNGMGYFIGVNRTQIYEGLFGFNAMLLGLFLGHEYEFNLAFWLLFFVAMLFVLIITVWLNSILGKHQLPFLSLPFIISSWIITLSVGNFSNILFNEDNVFVINHIASLKHNNFYQFVHSLDDLHKQLPTAVFIFFKTVAGTFFQTSLLAGIVITGALIYFSRIAFSLAVIGFASAYLFYSAFGADVNDLELNLVGSNFIFMSIAIGCFFLIPNIYSYLSSFILTPVLMLLLIFLNKILVVFQLKSLTLSFSLVVILTLLFLHHRWLHKYLHLVTIQYYSPEKTIYKFINSMKRFSSAHLAKIQLPFWGEWHVSQGYDGTITHLGDWGKALDFVITDDTNSTFTNSGLQTDDFYCFNKPIVAPLDGYVYDIVNYVEDNEIGGVDTQNNWGNSIILNHVNGLFTQISHIKKDSFKVNIGDYVTKGTLLATCGNSGRSPEPHIHFQVQLTPLVGAKTIAYPIAYFIEQVEGKQTLKYAEVPKQNTKISNVATAETLVQSFGFFPGQKLKWTTDNGEEVYWEVATDQFNKTYLHCLKTKSIAYFYNDGTLFYFYDFEGNKKSLLFHFYLASYRILLGIYPSIEIEDRIPLIYFNSPALQWIQDFIAPFYRFTNVLYTSQQVEIDDFNNTSMVKINSQITSKFIQWPLKQQKYTLSIHSNQIESFTVVSKHSTAIYTCVIC